MTTKTATPAITCDACDRKCSPNYRDHNEDLGGVFCATCTKAMAKADANLTDPDGSRRAARKAELGYGPAEVAWPEGTAKLYRSLFHKITAEVLGDRVARDRDTLTVTGIPAEDVSAVWAAAVADLLAFRRTDEYKALGVDTRKAVGEFQRAWHHKYLTRELRKLAKN